MISGSAVTFKVKTPFSSIVSILIESGVETIAFKMYSSVSWMDMFMLLLLL